MAPIGLPEIGLFEAIYSARSIRRLKPDPVPEELITRVLDAAIRAPSGGNAQSWAFVVVRDPDLRRQLGVIYRKASDIAEAVYAARGRPPHLTEQQFARLMAAGRYLWDHMGEAPVLLLPCSQRPVLPARRCPPTSRRTGRKRPPMPSAFAAPAFILRCRTSFSPAAVSGSAP
jgi:nitroreductase